MSQYSLGTVNVTNGSPVVAGQGSAWASALTAGQLFALSTDLIWYTILSVDSDTQITLTGNYVGATAASVKYLIQRDFTPNQGFPIPTFGDTGTASLIAKTLLELDAALTSMSALSQTLNGNITVDGNLTITANGGLTYNGVAITGSTLDSTAIGATTASTGKFTTLTTTGNATIGSQSGASATPTCITYDNSISNTAGQNLKLVLFSGAGLSYGLGVSNGELDVVTGGSVAFWSGATQVAKILSTGMTITGTLSATGAVTISSGTINGASVGATTASTGRFTTLTATGAATFSAGSIDGMPIGATTAATGKFTTLTTTGNATIGNQTGVASATPTCITYDNSFSNTAGQNLKLILFSNAGLNYGFGVSTGELDVVSGSNISFWSGVTQVAKITATGVTVTGTLSATGAATFTSGTINGMTIGATTASTGKFTTLTATAGTIDGASVGATTPSTGKFTTLTTTGALTVGGLTTFTGGAVAPADWNSNRFINSGFDVWQNGTSLSVNGTQVYIADQWVASITGNGGVAGTISKVSNVSGISSPNALNVTVAASAAALILVRQNFEGQAIADLAGQVASLSFDFVGSTDAGTFTVSIIGHTNSALDNSDFATLNFSPAYGAATSVTSFSGRISFTLTATQTALLNLGARIGMRVVQNTSAGNVNFTVGGFVLEKGAGASAWAPKPMSREILDCQRFFSCSWANLTGPTSTQTHLMTSPGVAIASGNLLPIGAVRFPVHMRATPTMTLYDGVGASGKIGIGAANGNSAVAAGVSPVLFNSITNNSGAAIAANTNVAFSWSASARL